MAAIVAHRAGRTVPQDPADRPLLGHGPSAWSTQATHRSICFEVNFELSAEDSQTVRLKEIFSKRFARNLRY
jgi:hypothetical protein